MQVPVKVIKANPTKIQSTASNLAGILSQDPELKYTAQRAFVSYLRSVNLQPNKEVFDVTRLPIAEFAASLGLPNAPRIRFKKRGAAKEEGSGDNPEANPKANGAGAESGSEESEDDGNGAKGVNKPGTSGRKDLQNGRGDAGDDVRTNGKGGKAKASEGAIENGEEVKVTNGDSTAKEAKKRSKMERLFGRKNADVLSDAYQKLRASDDDEAADVSGDEAGDLLRVKRKNHGLDGEDGESSKGALVKTARSVLPCLYFLSQSLLFSLPFFIALTHSYSSSYSCSRCLASCKHFVLSDPHLLNDDLSLPGFAPLSAEPEGVSV